MKPTVLVVDDSDLDRQMILDLLRAESPDAALVELHDGAEAIDYLLGSGSVPAPPCHPCLVLLDLHMPRVDGTDVLRRVRSEAASSRIPVVVFSSSNLETDLSRCYQLGANAYVVKPIDYAQFSAAVRGIAHFWIGLNQTAPERDPLGVPVTGSPAS